MATVPNLETERLVLTGLTLDDVPAYQQYFIDYEVIRHLSSLIPWPYPANGVDEFFRNILIPPQGIERWSWGIRLKSNPKEIIGCIDIWRKGTPDQRGFWLGKKFWGQGFMTEALGPVTAYTFEKLGFDSLTFANAVGNQRSRRIKEKTGARFVEVVPASFVDPQYTQKEIWSLTKEDWHRN